MDENADTPKTDEDDLIEVGTYPTLEEAHEHALVVLAMRQPCVVADADLDGEYSLHAEPDAATSVSKELAEYDGEQAVQTAPAADEHEVFRYPAGWLIYSIWASVLVLIHLWQGGNPDLSDAAASSSKAFIEGGEWWRPFTALFFHADMPHLAGNLLSGMLFGTLVSKCVGPLRGWLLILLSGAVGNTITSLVTYPQPFVSIGASSAVFGALGILTGVGFLTMLRARFRLPWARITAPLVAGVILLGWLGGGSPGGNTDVLGHVFGFGSGLAAGLAVGSLKQA